MELYDQKLIEMFGGIAKEKQLFFCHYCLQNDLDCRIEGEGKVYFGNETDHPMQVLGAYSNASKNWSWEWAKAESSLPEYLSEQSKQIKAYGEKHGFGIFTTEQFPIEKDDLHYIGLAALGISDSSGYCLADYPAGTMCITVNASDINKKFPNDHESIFTVFPGLVSEYEFNHREAFVNYLLKKHYKVDKKKSEVIGTKGKHKVKALFDDSDRLAELQ
ncbi:MAG: hypothetical protein FWG66_15030 [Spirochaetes bacterium]|nr:hypothetical protein [Spirochaetota bacterium]